MTRDFMISGHSIYKLQYMQTIKSLLTNNSVFGKLDIFQESLYQLQTGKDIEFSAQMLVDCTYGFKNYGCRGGWPWKAMQWVMKNGIATRKSYGRYLAEVR